MPIGIGVTGGLLRHEALETVSSQKALDSLQQIRTHLSQPGRDSGVLTLFNRTSTETEMTLERKSGFQLMFQKDDRLDDTVHAMKALLKQAGKDQAIVELETYLGSQGGKRNRIESGKMFEILNRHLPPLQKGTSVENLHTLAKIETVKVLGSGAYGRAYLVNIGGQEGVLKEFAEVQRLSLTRGSVPNEAMGSYLTSKKHPTYHLDKVNIAQPTLYMVSVEKRGKQEFQLVGPHEMRALVKQAKEDGRAVLCHGIVMPKAKGTEVARLIDEGTLTDNEKKQYIRGTLESIKGLNERGFVHRDLKPENSYFDKETGSTTLIDTGSLYKTSKNQDKPQTIDGSYPFGTLPHMHPRAILQQEHGTETDLYALGISVLRVDHPVAFMHLIRDIARQNSVPGGVTQDWLRDTLDKKIAATESEELRNALIALRDDIDDPEKLSGFAMTCFDLARLPSDSWKDREFAQQAYAQLLRHPGLQDNIGDNG